MAVGEACPQDIGRSETIANAVTTALLQKIPQQNLPFKLDGDSPIDDLPIDDIPVDIDGLFP